MFDEQPSLIQEYEFSEEDDWPWEKRRRAPIPLFLIHDGGGTIFSYYCLRELDRPLYGIANPNFDSGAAWAGGIPEMARHYRAFIRSALPSGGDVIVGGWSLGGLISLEIAHQIAEEARRSPPGEPRLRVVGIVMVDSICPVIAAASWRPIVEHNIVWSENTREETKQKVMRCFSEALRMVKEWKLPDWEGEEGEEGEKGEEGDDGERAPLRPPPVVLLRALECVPEPGEGLSRVDIHRSDPQLGWGLYRKDLIAKVIDIPGHHFNLFHTEENLDATTEAIKKACREIEMRANFGSRTLE
ncbi:hypothetical protein VTG60DRAFT_5877 [Thermothelomyces hinnuleus]